MTLQYLTPILCLLFLSAPATAFADKPKVLYKKASWTVLSGEIFGEKGCAVRSGNSNGFFEFAVSEAGIGRYGARHNAWKFDPGVVKSMGIYVDGSGFDHGRATKTKNGIWNIATPMTTIVAFKLLGVGKRLEVHDETGRRIGQFPFNGSQNAYKRWLTCYVQLDRSKWPKE